MLYIGRKFQHRFCIICQLLDSYIVRYYIVFYITGVAEESSESIDAMAPNTKEEFDRFGAALSHKINQFSKHTDFPHFAEELIKSIALNC